ncbi:VOC family protein [Streptomyces sp. NPDC047987]|uniref:VOC family protein n=1 Tax=unclassified Streptomyces TaxID=2593676 RepID=UPI003439EC90
MKLTGPVPGGPCWVELSTSDVPAAQSFYAAVLGWRPETDPRPEAGGCTTAYLGDARVAALSPTHLPEQPTAWTVSFATRDTDAAVEKVKGAGGSLLVGPLDVPDEGRFAVVADPSGAVFSLWQPRAFAGFERLNAPGALGWVELVTHEAEPALAFYPEVFGWTVNGASEKYPQWSLAGDDFGGLVVMDDAFAAYRSANWLPYFGVTDVDAAAATAQGAGGELLMPPTSVRQAPRMAVVRDPQGAAFGIHRAVDED